jgi:outer membrane immunogenic protein
MAMKRLAVAASILAASAAGASAADMAPRYTKAPAAAPVLTYDWSGIYIGANVGYGWGRSTGTGANAAGFFPVSYSLDPSGVIGGGFVGGNYQINNVVLGIEADWQAADLNESGNFLLGGVPTYTYATKIKDYGSVRGRLGLAFDRWMVFGTGGFAWGSWETSYAFIGGVPFVTADVDSHAGWTAGAGVEYAFANNWLARAEYRYTDLGRASFVDLTTNSSELGNRVTINDVRVGIAYKFGGATPVAATY